MGDTIQDARAAMADRNIELDFYNRIRAIAWVGWENGYDTLVLGPAGCGAFNNDPRIVAEVFYNVFVLEFPGVFKHIEMAYLVFNQKDSDGYQHFRTNFINRANAAAA